MTTEQEFNLVDEPWILATDHAGELREVSLRECFRQAHELKELSGELPTQDVAVLRLLLAVMYAVYARPLYARNGATAENALEMWKHLWGSGSFPMEPLETYFGQWKERFWLFHPERPFYQVPKPLGTGFGAAKLMGDLSESGNKPRLFSTRSGRGKECIPFGEAARWLLYLNAFDDTSSKPSPLGKGKPSVGAGWLGRLGLLYVEGKNLFETLLLNWVLFDPFNREMYECGKDLACWEPSAADAEERVLIDPLHDPLALLTLQSRRIHLEKSPAGEGVVGFALVHGVGFTSVNNAFMENMTPWRYDEKDTVYKPKSLDPAKQLWRDFQSLTMNNEGKDKHGRPPGVVAWISLLKDEEILPFNGLMRIRTCGVKYGDKFFFVDDVFADALDVNLGLLANLAGNAWLPRIYHAVDVTDKAVKALGWMARELTEASGGSGKNNLENAAGTAREQAYFALDIPFRRWLTGIDPGRDDMDERSSEWLGILRSVLRNQAEEMAKGAGMKSLAGRGTLNSAVAYGKFIRHLNRITEGGRL